jgi:hypothetical protein
MLRTFSPEKSDGFGHERIRDLVFQSTFRRAMTSKTTGSAMLYARGDGRTIHACYIIRTEPSCTIDDNVATAKTHRCKFNAAGVLQSTDQTTINVTGKVTMLYRAKIHLLKR